MASKVVMLFLYLGLFIHFIYAVPERGIKEMVFDVNGQYKSFAKSLFKDAKITINGHIVIKGDPKTKTNIESLSLNWYLLRSDCAQYFVQVKEDILSALIVPANQDPKAHPLHTMYSKGVLTFNDDNLHNKTVVTLEREIPKQKETSDETKEETSDEAKKKTSDEAEKDTSDEVKEETFDEVKEETTKEKTPKEKTPKEKTPKEKTTKEKTPKEKTPKEKTPKEKTPKEKTPKEKTPKEKTPKEKTPKEKTPKRKTSKRKEETSDELEKETSDEVEKKTLKTKKAPAKPIKNAHLQQNEDSRKKREAAAVKSRKKGKGDKTPPKAVQTIAPTTAMKGPPKAAGLDGNYLLVISLKEKLPEDVSIQVKVSIKMNTGYLSAAEWPLLPFYGAMSLVYLAYGVVWLIVSACQWRELLRIQFWIGGVIALGMLEKAVLFSEYNNVNDTGIPAHGLVVLALVLSCIKRTLSRILIIIVSMGFGIVKPRLGSALHRVLGVGCLYFILSVIEGSYREFSVKADVNRKQVIASVPLSVLDAVICWWIFMSLLQTMRTLRIRKNLVKLSLYRHFTNILVVSVIVSVAFMAWVIKAHSFNSCIKDWKEIWIDDAFWHFLFALILLAIMVLWRPTVNNQRYAFTPLIDVGEEDDDDMTLSDAFQGMKMRGKGEGETPSRADKQRKKAEDDLKWVEENIPTSGGIDTALPSLLDSDEEMMTTKLEMNKME